MISTALVASLLLPCHASFAAITQLGATRRLAAAAQGRLMRFPNMATWRRLGEDITQCGIVHFTTHDIEPQRWGGFSHVAADLDGDGDLDVLSIWLINDKASWYENVDGAGNFPDHPRVISTQTDSTILIKAAIVAAADLDGDGDLDVLSQSYYENIIWHENLYGAGNFSGPQRIITTQGDGVRSLAAADLDGDGDLDVLSHTVNKIAWYENINGAGSFSEQQRVSTTSANDTMSVVAADLDGDGALDVLSAFFDDDKIAWYKNLNGIGNFSGPQRVITIQADGARSVSAADLDGDGDLDVLSASENDDKIAWYENLDGAGNFSGPQRIITTQADGASSVAAADLDGDADLDVLLASNKDDKIAWYENLDGAGNFSKGQRVITISAFGPRSVAAADLDNDGDLDILSDMNSMSNMIWYENECEPMTPQPTSQPTPERTPHPTREPTYWGPQVFGKQPQTAGFERLCVAWCVVFGVASAVVLGYVVHASPHKDKNLARTILTIVLSQYDFGSDTLFIAFHNFVTPTLFVAALIAYLLPLAVFIVVYRRLVGAHLNRFYTSTKAKTIVRFDSWNEFQKALTEIGSFALFLLAFAASTFVYLILLFVFISCKLMSVSFFAVKFFEIGGFKCTQEAFEVMFKRNIVSELVFESSGELIIVLVDTSLRAQRDFRSNAGLSLWAVLSIVGSILMLVIEVWPYLYHIVCMGLGLNAGIAAVSTSLKFTPDIVLGTWLIDRLVRLAEGFASRVQTVTDKLFKLFKGKDQSSSEVHVVKTFESADQREQ